MVLKRPCAAALLEIAAAEWNQLCCRVKLAFVPMKSVIDVQPSPTGLCLEAVRAYVRQRYPRALPLRGIHFRALRGGISAASTLKVRASISQPGEKDRPFGCVAKVLLLADAREAAVYEHLAAHRLDSLGPKLFFVHQREGAVVLLLEHVRAEERWPWREERHSLAVLKRLATLHRAALADLAKSERDWCYERELEHNARELAQFVSEPRHARGSTALRRTAPAIRRLEAALPRLRRELLQATGTVFIHGDAHPGNALVAGHDASAVLLDWGRARIGSPLEDASSWLMSLGCWEYGARKRHDTLLTGYLREAGRHPLLSRELREAYWLAGASNAMAGALLHHLRTLASEQASSRERFDAERASEAWMRTLRRAHAVWA